MRQNPLEQKKQLFNIKTELEKIQDVSNVEKIELDAAYLDWLEKDLRHSDHELYKAIIETYRNLDVFSFGFISEETPIRGYLWLPKVIEKPLPLVLWNRGGTGSFGMIGTNRGNIYSSTPCDFAQLGNVVIASDIVPTNYSKDRDGRAKDEWGGSTDLASANKLREIAQALPVTTSGKIVVAGVSRGGMMSYLLASKESWVEKVIVLAGEVDLVKSVEERPEMRKVFDDSFGGTEEEMKKRSATYFYEEIPKDLPVLIFQGIKDDRVSVEEVRKLVQLLQESGHNVEYHEFNEGEHDLSGPGKPNRKEVLKIIESFLK